MAMTMHAAVAELVERFPGAYFVSTCGYITRDLLAHEDRDANFYLMGSMGMAAPIGLGLSLAVPGSTVVVLDGDGSFAMNLSALPVLGSVGEGIVHVVLDNGVHASTGGQRTVAINDISALAVSAGYASATKCSNDGEISRVAISATGVHLIHVECAARDYPIGDRLRLTPAELVARFRKHVAATSAAAVAAA